MINSYEQRLKYESLSGWQTLITLFCLPIAILFFVVPGVNTFAFSIGLASFAQLLIAISLRRLSIYVASYRKMFDGDEFRSSLISHGAALLFYHLSLAYFVYTINDNLVFVSAFMNSMISIGVTLYLYVQKTHIYNTSLFLFKNTRQEINREMINVTITFLMPILFSLALIHWILS